MGKIDTEDVKIFGPQASLGLDGAFRAPWRGSWLSEALVCSSAYLRPSLSEGTFR
jgi:hypothetical protein